MNIAKKQWMAPVATEIEVNTGVVNGEPEQTATSVNNFS
jgi:hypothetical protein